MSGIGNKRVDVEGASGVLCTVIATAPNEPRSIRWRWVLHGQEEAIVADAATPVQIGHRALWAASNFAACAAV